MQPATQYAGQDLTYSFVKINKQKTMKNNTKILFLIEYNLSTCISLYELPHGSEHTIRISNLIYLSIGHPYNAFT